MATLNEILEGMKTGESLSYQIAEFDRVTITVDREDKPCPYQVSQQLLGNNRSVVEGGRVGVWSNFVSGWATNEENAVKLFDNYVKSLRQSVEAMARRAS